MNTAIRIFSCAGTLLLLAIQDSEAQDEKREVDKLYEGVPIKALLITGGCCHNYLFQSLALTEGVEKYADVEWTVVNEGGNGTQAEIELYGDPDWANPYDLVVHNECFANTARVDYKSKTKALKP